MASVLCTQWPGSPAPRGDNLNHLQGNEGCIRGGQDSWESGRIFCDINTSKSEEMALDFQTPRPHLQIVSTEGSQCGDVSNLRAPGSPDG